MRSADQIKRMLHQLKQLAERLDPDRDQEEIRLTACKIEMLEWVLEAPSGKYHA